MAFLDLFLTSISTSVPFLCHPFSTYPMAIFFSKVGDGIPDVTVPMKSLDEGLKILAPSAVDPSQNPHKIERERELTTSRSTIDHKPDPPPWRPILQVLQHQIGTNETTSLSSLLADDPAESGFNGRCVFAEVLTIQTHPRLESETVSGTETGQFDWSLREQFCDFDGFCGRHRDLQGLNVSIGSGESRKRGVGYTSKPSSPVYPPLATCRLNPSRGTNADLPNVSDLKSNDVNVCRYLAASGPCRANNPHPSKISISTFPLSPLLLSLFHSSIF